MKIRFVFLFALVLLSACNTSQETPVPTGSVDFFYDDSTEVVKIFKVKSANLSPLTVEEQKVIQDYEDKYFRNPRLDDDQLSLYNKFTLLNVSYFLYSTRDEEDSESVKNANDAIESFFKTLRDFDEDGNLLEDWYKNY